MIHLVVAWAVLGAEPRHRLDMPLPPAPDRVYGHDGAPVFRRDVGTGTVLFVNFDGIDLGDCNPSNSKKNCHWYNQDPIAPFSGGLTERVSVLQAMRRHADQFGIRITGLRPPSSIDYTMVIYGGTEETYEALGSAPSGDCFDQNPNEIAFVHMDGELAGWINAGATTALHEAAHTWGLDHVDLEGEIMYPSGNNSPTAFDDACLQIVADTELAPGGESCPDLNAELCDAADRQNAPKVLTGLFGAAYVDAIAPEIELVEPHDGAYFQVPGNFDVELALSDDLHPQQYSMWAWQGDGPRPADAKPTVEPGFAVVDLPVGTWQFHVVVADEAGNESQLDFEIEVGVDPPPDPPSESGCGCACPPARSGLVALPLLLAMRRRRR